MLSNSANEWVNQGRVCARLFQDEIANARPFTNSATCAILYMSAKRSVTSSGSLTVTWGCTVSTGQAVL